MDNILQKIQILQNTCNTYLMLAKSLREKGDTSQSEYYLKKEVNCFIKLQKLKKVYLNKNY
jgi:hypothetical protein